MSDRPNKIQPVLSAAHMELATTFGTTRHVAAGEVLFHPGDPTHDLYVVHSGLIAVLDRTDGGEDLIISHGARTIVGEFDLLSGQAAFLEGRALLDSNVQAIPPTELRRLLDSQAELGDIVLTTLVARRDALLERVASSLRMVGRRHSIDTLRLRDLLARNRVPHEWIDEPASVDQFLDEHELDESDLPVAITSRSTMRTATPGAVAEHLGLTLGAIDADQPVDVTIVGAGPAGLAAAVYAASEGLDTLVIESTAPGGQAGTSARIENYLGFPTGLSGAELTDRALTQALKFGARFCTPCDVTGIEPAGRHLAVRLASGETLKSRTVIAATGATYRRLNVDNLERFEGRGIYYAATAVEARLVADRPVVVVGGGNSAGQAALFLAKHCSDVTIAVRGDDLGANMSDYLVQRLTSHPDIEVLLRTEVTGLGGDTDLQAVRFTNDEEWWSADAVGLFSFIGAAPTANWLAGTVDADPAGFVLTGPIATPDRTPEALPYETRTPGLFVIGDVRAGSTKRVASAVGDGAEVIRSVHQYLGGHAAVPAV